MEQVRQARFECNCDTVVEMEELGVGVEEILQYAAALLSREEVLGLIRGLQEITAHPLP